MWIINFVRLMERALYQHHKKRLHEHKTHYIILILPECYFDIYTLAVAQKKTCQSPVSLI